MELTLYTVSLRGRKAYKDNAGTLYLECTGCKAIKDHYSFTKDKQGFQGKRSDCMDCRNKVNREYRKKRAYKKAYTRNS